MLEPGKIGGKEVKWLLVLSILPVALTVPLAIETAKQDVWISILFALPVTVILFVVIILARRQLPDLEFVPFLEKIFGKWLGRIIAWLFVVLLFVKCTLTLNQVGYTLELVLLTHTPDYVISIFLLLLAMYAVFLGLEPLARTIVLISGLFVTMLLLVNSTIIFDFYLINLRPFLGQGWLPVLKGSYSYIANIGEIIILAIIWPYIGRQKEIVSNGLKAIGWVVFLIFLFLIASIGVFGPNLAAIFELPFYEVVRYFRFGEISRLDAYITTIWTAGIFVRVSVLFYLVVLLCGQLFNLRNYRYLIIPIAILLFIVTQLSVRDIFTLEKFIEQYLITIQFFIEIFFPLVTVVVLYFRKARWKKS